MIPKYNDMILIEFWNVCTIQKVPDTKSGLKSGNKTKSTHSDDGKKNIKEDCKEGKRNGFSK